MFSMGLSASARPHPPLSGMAAAGVPGGSARLPRDVCNRIKQHAPVENSSKPVGWIEWYSARTFKFLALPCEEDP